MSVTTTPLTVGNSLRVLRDTDADNTAEKNVNDGAATIYVVVLDNTANGGQDVYAKFYDDANPTVGTTAPHMVLYGPAGLRRTYVFKSGLTFSTALSYACVTTAGTGGTTSPTSDVPLDVVVG